jgi:hypothetical protein
MVFLRGKKSFFTFLVDEPFPFWEGFFSLIRFLSFTYAIRSERLVEAEQNGRIKIPECPVCEFFLIGAGYVNRRCPIMQ